MKEIRTDKFTENTLSIRRFFDLDRQTITAWNLAALMLSARSEDFPDRQAFSQACSHAYGARSGYGMFGYGRKFLFEYRISWIRSDLVDSETYPREIIHLIDQSLRHPLLSQQSLDEAKYLLRNRLLAISQDPDLRAAQEALRAAGQNGTLGISMQGYLEDLDQITLEDIQSLVDQLARAPFETLILGQPGEEVMDYVQSFYPGQTIETSWAAASNQDVREVVLEKDISQSSLVQIYTTGILPQDPQYTALLVLNALLGSSSVSLLFEIIREQHSYCYSISSTLIRFDGVLMISTAARRRNLPKVRELISQILDDIRHARFSPDTFETVKNEMCDTLAGQKDSPAGMIEQEFLNEVLHRPASVEEIIQKIQAVTPEQVAQAASNLQLIASAELLEKQEETTDETAD